MLGCNALVVMYHDKQESSNRVQRRAWYSIFATTRLMGAGESDIFDIFEQLGEGNIKKHSSRCKQTSVEGNLLLALYHGLAHLRITHPPQPNPKNKIK